MADVYATIDGGTPEGGEQSLAGELGGLLLLVSNQLEDEGAGAWPPSKTLPYVNLAFLEIVKLRPDAYPVERVVQLVAGARQSVSATTTIAILDAICNMGTGGATVGNTITMIKKAVLDQLIPNWMTYPSNQVVSHIAKDEINPLVFYAFPPQPTSAMNQIKLLVSAPPDTITESSTAFPLNPSYKPAFVDYLIYRCLSESTTIQNAQVKAATYFNKFMSDLGIQK